MHDVLAACTIRVPRSLTDNNSIEALYGAVSAPSPASAYMLDLSTVDFVTPDGVLALIMVARWLADRSGQPITLLGLRAHVHLYLQRMNVFAVARAWLRPATLLDDAWARNPATPNLLELTMICGSKDVEVVMTRAEHMFQRWLHLPDIHTVLGVLSEVCANVYQHSGDPHGCVLIQKYEMGRFARIVVAVGDGGCGVRGSLHARHGVLGHGPLVYLREAMHGRTARATGRGGLGLRTIERAARACGGSLWLRSETAAVLCSGSTAMVEHDGLVHTPGTQLTVHLRAPLRA